MTFTWRPGWPSSSLRPDTIASFFLSFFCLLGFDLNFFFVILALGSGCGVHPLAQPGALLPRAPREEGPPPSVASLTFEGHVVSSNLSCLISKFILKDSRG